MQTQLANKDTDIVPILIVAVATVLIIIIAVIIAIVVAMVIITIIMPSMRSSRG